MTVKNLMVMMIIRSVHRYSFIQMAEEQPEQLTLDAIGAGITVRGCLDAYAAIPGTGPAGESCRTCRNSRRRNHGHRAYWKCRLVRESHGPATDIRLKTPACRRWKSKERKP